MADPYTDPPSSDTECSSDSSSDYGADDGEISGFECPEVFLTPQDGSHLHPRISCPYRTYIPAWTRPPAHAFGGRPFGRHPAVLREDQVKNPTIYARRFGIDGDSGPNDADGVSLAQGRSGLTPTEEDDPNHDYLESWQRYVFQGYTSRELRDIGAFDPTNPLPTTYDGLQDPILHPLLQREKWRQPIEEGEIPEKPGLFFTDRLRYSASEDRIWAAMQPALRLVTKILLSDPPFWRAITNMYHMRPVDADRLPLTEEQRRNMSWETLTSFWLDIDENAMYPEARQLRALNFDARTMALDYLNAYVRFCFLDSSAHKDQIYGMTSVFPPFVEGPCWDIRIYIAAQLVWPLIIPNYSAAENDAASFLLAETILHELAHAAVTAQIIMLFSTDRGETEDPILRTFSTDPAMIPQQQRDLIASLRRKMIGRINKSTFAFDPIETFFEDDFMAEEGFAFETQLWGACVNVLNEHRFGHEDGFPAVIMNTVSWPVERPDLKSIGRSQWPTWLVSPPPTRIGRYTAIPHEMLSQYLKESFWSPTGHVARFGHGALKLSTATWNGVTLKSHLRHPEPRRKEYRQAFRRRSAFKWVKRVHKYLVRRKHSEVAAYMQALTNIVVEGRIMRLRLREEQRLWHQADEKIRVRWEEMERWNGQAIGALANYILPVAALPYTTIAPEDSRIRSILRFATDACRSAADLQRLVAAECVHLQFLVLGLVKQDQATRQSLLQERSVGALLRRIRGGYLDRAVQAARTTLLSFWQNWREKIGICLDRGEVHGNIRLHLDVHVDMMGKVLANLAATRQALDEIETLLRNCAEQSQPLLRAEASQFGLLTVATVQGTPQYLRAVAMRRMRQMRPDDPSLPLIGIWLDVLASVKQLEVATREERSMIRQSLRKAFRVLPSISAD